MRILFLASIATKRNHFNGEVNKSKDLLDAMKLYYKLKACNLTNQFTRLFSITRFLLLAKFWNPDFVFIGKSPFGAAVALKLLRTFKFPLNNVVVYSYGRGLEGYYQDKIHNIDDFSKVKCLIVENKAAAESFEKFGCTNIATFPCVKKTYELLPKTFQGAKETLKAIFFARVTVDKGVLMAIEAVQSINKRAGFAKFSLTISGSCVDKALMEKILTICNADPNIKFIGTSLSITGYKSYVELSEFDLNVFPTMFFHECAPGSVVDMFIAGVPTASSDFQGYQYMLNDEFAYIFKQGSLESLICCLESIYRDQEKLFKKRSLCFEQANKYSYQSFLNFFKKITE